jgi:hypothetical protein
MRKGNRRSIFLLSFCLIVTTILVGLYVVDPAIVSADEDFEFKWILPPNNYKGQRFCEGRAWVQEKENGLWTLYAEDGSIIKSDFKAHDIWDYEGGFARFRLKPNDVKRYGFIDISGDVVIQPDYFGINSMYSEGLVNKDNGDGFFGYVDLNGDWIISPDYNSADIFHEGLAPVRKDKKYGYIDKSGNVVIDFSFDIAQPFAYGSAVVGINPLYGLIDKSGKFIVEPKYEEYVMADSNFIAVVQDDKVGFIDRQGNVVIDFKFKNVRSKSSFIVGALGIYIFDKGRAMVVLDEPGTELERAIIDEHGDIVYRLSNGNIKSIFVMTNEEFNGDFLPVVTVEGYCIYDRNGKLYNLSRYIKFPERVTITAGSNVFNVWERDRDGKRIPGTTGYFTITPKGE